MVHIKDTLPSEREAAALSSALKEIWQEVLFSLGKSFGFTKKLHSLKTTRDEVTLNFSGKERKTWKRELKFYFSATDVG